MTLLRFTEPCGTGPFLVCKLPIMAWCPPESGTQIDWVRRQLGHSSITLTVDVYGEWGRQAQKREAEKLRGAFPV